MQKNVQNGLPLRFSPNGLPKKRFPQTEGETGTRFACRDRIRIQSDYVFGVFDNRPARRLGRKQDSPRTLIGSGGQSGRRACRRNSGRMARLADRMDSDGVFRKPADVNCRCNRAPVAGVARNEGHSDREGALRRFR